MIAGVVSKLVGGSTASGVASGFADGTGFAATFNEPTGIAIDTLGLVFISDSTNNMIRKITSSGYLCFYEILRVVDVLMC